MDNMQGEEINSESQEKEPQKGNKNFENEGNTAIAAPQPSSSRYSFHRRTYVFKKIKSCYSRDSFYCSFCKVIFCSVFSLKRHLVKIHAVDEASISKKILSSVTSTMNIQKENTQFLSTAMTPMTSVENESRQSKVSKPSGCYSCCFCSANFVHLSDFLNHMCTHHFPEFEASETEFNASEFGSEDSESESSASEKIPERDCHDLQQSQSMEFSNEVQNQMQLDEPRTLGTISCPSCRLRCPGPQALEERMNQVHLSISFNKNCSSTSMSATSTSMSATSTSSQNLLNPSTPPNKNDKAPMIKLLDSTGIGQSGGNDDTISEDGDEKLCNVCGEEAQETGCSCTRTATGYDVKITEEFKNIDPSVDPFHSPRFLDISRMLVYWKNTVI